MPYVNYIKENEAFIADASDMNLCANARLLWYALFHVFNQRANGGVWQDGLISINNKTLLSLVPFSEDALVKARNQLAQHGFIRYKSGERRAANPQYAMICANERRGIEAGEDGDEDSRPFYPTKTGKTIGKTDGKTVGKTDGKTIGKTVYQYPNYNKDQNETPYLSDDDEDVEDDPSAHADTREPWEIERDRLLPVVRTAFSLNFGRRPTAAIADSLARIFQAYHAIGIVDDVISRAAEKGANDPVAYIRAMLNDAQMYNALTPEKYHKYQHLTDLLRDEKMLYMLGKSRAEVIQELDSIGEQES